MLTSIDMFYMLYLAYNNTNQKWLLRNKFLVKINKQKQK